MSVAVQAGAIVATVLLWGGSDVFLKRFADGVSSLSGLALGLALSAVGSLFYLVLLRRGLLDAHAILSVTCLAATAILARLLFNEDLDAARITGIVASIVALVAFAFAPDRLESAAQAVSEKSTSTELETDHA